ncbi:GlxA family transcriptional regulator [Variovorax sp. 770b2]|uniref:GlxA family transcriptional regulator n=1 Tax=Variovorax sp. 770b2 TaxID=1566271 RepID=UPI0008EE7716|nr:GlxA family transcriptional regulator [Variovorax sp. 770b2]SFP14513.1 Transcriptional regulator GlxA family, contains an amidase domain and an AraC-type DNA-binding HTH domain [Variovorax sp. 770b2]
MHRIAYTVVPNFQVMVFAGMTVFELANRIAPEPYYDVHLLSAEGGLVQTSMGIPMPTELAGRKSFDTVIAAGALDIEPAPKKLLAFLRRAATSSRRIASVCTGAFVLAEAGVLNGRRATTHWSYARDLQANYPQVKVEEDRIFVVDGPVWTSAGMTASIDLALGMVERDLGTEHARTVAKRLVVYQRRGGGQMQHSALLDLDAKTDRIQSALAFARRNLHKPLAVEHLAEAAHLSPRQFSRAFRAETGQSPAKAIETLRVEAARVMMEQSRHPIEVVASETGFADRERMRRAFLRAFGQPPQAMRRNAKIGAATTED